MGFIFRDNRGCRYSDNSDNSSNVIIEMNVGNSPKMKLDILEINRPSFTSELGIFVRIITYLRLVLLTFQPVICLIFLGKYKANKMQIKYQKM